MTLNFRSLLWTLLADVLVIVTLEVFFPSFIDREDALILIIVSIILWLWECRKNR